MNLWTLLIPATFFFFLIWISLESLQNYKTLGQKDPANLFIGQSKHMIQLFLQSPGSMWDEGGGQ